jgi:hypothetical protein
MRHLLMLPLLVLAACQVSKDDQNDSVTMSYNEEVAANAASDASNFAGDVAEDVSNSAAKVGNKVDDLDVDVDVQTDGEPAQANAN